ncbi:BnaC02g25040D [Brassica napus]|uniref:BnaC02g25040D protein n=1 Tax=Brassica napus TaxID=3708 RepID=A0A078FNZ2_BRANA|nr:BnaC02g25040D [Brassica napus]
MSVKLFFWNVRGLNEPTKHGPFISWFNTHRPLFGAILESHVKEPSLNTILSSLCPGCLLPPSPHL